MILLTHNDKKSQDIKQLFAIIITNLMIINAIETGAVPGGRGAAAPSEISAPPPVAPKNST